MQPSHFDEVSFFRDLHRSGARTLLIGRRALVMLGLPVLTADYDFWLAIDDIATFNAVGERFDLRPTRTPDEARQRGRYVLEVRPPAAPTTAPDCRGFRGAQLLVNAGRQDRNTAPAGSG